MSDIFKFLTKDNLLYLVSWIYLKVRFLLECLLLILAKSLLNSLADLVIFPTTENSDVSRVSNFALDAKSSDKSFIYILEKTMAQVQEPLLQLPPMKSHVHLEQLFSFVDIKCILHNFITYLVCHFL